jgi:adenylate kinase
VVTFSGIYNTTNFRQNIEDKTEIGLKVQNVIRNGSLVSNDIISALVINSMGTLKGSFLLDGFPRTISQARELDNFMRKNGNELNYVINLDVPCKIILI